MDLVLNLADKYIFDYIYPATWDQQCFWRQSLSLWFIVVVGAYLLYFIFSSLDFFFLYDKNNLKDRRILKNQIAKEIACCCWAIPIMGIYSLPFYMVSGKNEKKENRKKFK